MPTKTQKVRPHSMAAFQREITVRFLETLMMVKLYHWKTTSYATHKATDELYTKLNANMDAFIEILIGKTGTRTQLKRPMAFVDVSSQTALKQAIDQFKQYLIQLNDNKAMKRMSNTDLFNIRDTLLGDLNQFLYLLTFS